MSRRRGDLAVHESGLASLDPQLSLLLQRHDGARLKLDRLGLSQQVIRWFEIAFPECSIGRPDEFGNPAFRLGQFL